MCAVCQVSDPADDLVEKHHIDRIQVTLYGEQGTAQIAFVLVCFVFKAVQFGQQLLDHLDLMATEARCHQLVELMKRFPGLVGGLECRIEEFEHTSLQSDGNRHLPTQHQPGDILGFIGDLVLHTDQVEQVGARDGQEQVAWEVLANLSLDGVCLVLQFGNLPLVLSGFLPVLLDHRLEKRDEFSGACLRLIDMFLHRHEGRTGEHLEKGAVYH